MKKINYYFDLWKKPKHLWNKLKHKPQETLEFKLTKTFETLFFLLYHQIEKKIEIGSDV